MDQFIPNDEDNDDIGSLHELESDEDYATVRGKSIGDDEQDYGSASAPLKNKKKIAFDAFDESDEESDLDVVESGNTAVGQYNSSDNDDVGSEKSDEDENEKKNENKSASNDSSSISSKLLLKEDEENRNELFRKSKLSKLKLQSRKPKGKTGVVYLSRIPPYMKPTKMRQILSVFGEVDRLFLKKESSVKQKKRVRAGGNKKDMYEEGWAEFIRKKDAKMCAATLNGNKLGGKKGNFYYDDIMNVKYLSGFKWSDLTAQISRENESRQSKLQMEISQSEKLNKTFIRNVERSKMINNMKAKRAERKGSEDDEPVEIKRTFEQRKVNSIRADGPKEIKGKKNSNLESVLSQVF